AIWSCLSPDSCSMLSLGSSLMSTFNSTYISATLRRVSRNPSRFGSSPMPSRIKRTPWAIRSRSGSLGLRGFRRLDLMSVTFVFISKINRAVPGMFECLVSEPRAVATGSCQAHLIDDDDCSQSRLIDPVATARGSDASTLAAQLPELHAKQ